MDRRMLYLGLGLGAALALFLYSRTESGAKAIGSVSDSIGDTVNQVVSAVRGIRNNNPGNIRKSGTAWQGLSATQDDPAFFQFDSMAYGVRAIVKILRTYQESYGLNTVRKIIARWAPPSENDTGAYVAYVAEKVGVSPDMPIDVHNEETMFRLVRGIIAQENGVIPAQLVSDTTVTAGIDLA